VLRKYSSRDARPVAGGSIALIEFPGVRGKAAWMTPATGRPRGLRVGIAWQSQRSFNRQPWQPMTTSDAAVGVQARRRGARADEPGSRGLR